MGKLYYNAMREKRDRELLEFLERCKAMSSNGQYSADEITALLEERIRDLEEQIAKIDADRSKVYEGTPWDFTAERAAEVFAEDNDLRIRPIRQSDREFYYAIRRQYALEPSGAYYDPENDFLWQEIQTDRCFFCIVELTGIPIGYISVKDTCGSPWEIAIELDGPFCGHGYGPRIICAFLRTMEEITLRSLFIAKVDVSNYASQKCMAKIGAKLTGISNDCSLSADERERFEKENASLVDDHMRQLAAALDVDPTKLLTHVLVYEIEVLPDD